MLSQVVAPCRRLPFLRWRYAALRWRKRRLGRAPLCFGINERGLPGKFVTNKVLLPIHIDLSDIELLLGRLDLCFDVDLNGSQGLRAHQARGSAP